MTNEQYLRYFENRPSLNEIHVVGSVVFIDAKAAKKYAGQINSKVELKSKKDLQDAYEKEKLDLVELTPEEAKAKVLSMELNEDSDYHLLQDLVKALELNAEGKSKNAYLAALLNFKAEQNNESSSD